ncbi:MAG: phage portal protein [Candidatus Cloacimonetes bacterium]|nr:phage portal protein [Candidatus Cloacimonadota bacterium]
MKTKLSTRKFSSASIDRLLGSFDHADPMGINEKLKSSLSTMRDRTRQGARDNEYIIQYINYMIANVIGPEGIRLQVKTSNKKVNKLLESKWKEFCRRKNFSIDQSVSCCEAQALALRSLLIDGEYIIKKEMVVIADKPTFAIRFINPDRLDENNTSYSETNDIKMGIEKDSLGRVLNYHILKGNPRAYFIDPKARLSQSIPSKQIIHGFVIEFVDQVRGIPKIQSVLTRLKLLSRYDKAVLVAVIISAQTMGFFTKDLNDSELDEYGDEQEEQEPLYIEAEAGSFQELPPGYNLQEFDPKFPQDNYENFTTRQLQAISSGLGCSYSALSSDLTKVSYSSMRQGALNDRESFKQLQSILVHQFLQPIFEEFLSFERDFGNDILISSRSFDFLNQAKWQCRRWDWVDPLKDASANKTNVESGFMTQEQVWINQGLDPEEQWEKWQEQLEKYKSIGFTNHEEMKSNENIPKV